MTEMKELVVIEKGNVSLSLYMPLYLSIYIYISTFLSIYLSILHPFAERRCFYFVFFVFCFFLKAAVTVKTAAVSVD